MVNLIVLIASCLLVHQWHKMIFMQLKVIGDTHDQGWNFTVFIPDFTLFYYCGSCDEHREFHLLDLDLDRHAGLGSSDSITEYLMVPILTRPAIPPA